MSHTRVKTTYEVEGAHGSTELTVLYCDHNHSCDTITFYDVNGNLEGMAFHSFTKDNNLWDAMNRLWFPFKDEWGGELKEGVEYCTAVKASEFAKQKEVEEDNVWREMSLSAKAHRLGSWEEFIEVWVPKIKLEYQLEVVADKSKVIIATKSAGIVEYFPKANSLLIRRNNKWIKFGAKKYLSKVLGIDMVD